MLIEFSVKNFMSFKEKVTFSMEAGLGKENSGSVFAAGKYNLLKQTAIYGANAAGKSGFIKALTTAIMMVRLSNMNQVGIMNFIPTPFAFDDKTKDGCSDFEFVFIATDKVRYKYGYSADVHKVYKEYLYAYYTQKPTVIFNRTAPNKYAFLKEDERFLNGIVKHNIDNKLFLSTATAWGYDKTKPAFEWFAKSIDTFDNFASIKLEDLRNLSLDKSDLKTFALELLKQSDIAIKDIVVKEIKNNMEGNGVFAAPINPFVPQVQFDIKMVHEVINEDGTKSDYLLDFVNESTGTKILFGLIPFLKRAYENNRVLVIDEFGTNLHPMLVSYIVKLFSSSMNKANSQLIFTTHDTNLMAQLRRDQIWFINKDENTGVSELYALDEFSIREKENFSKEYLNNRFGATPFIKEVL